MKDKNCTSVPIEITSCAIYVGLIGSDNVTKEGCESVKNALEYLKCVYNEESKSCITETLPCADYKGKDPTISLVNLFPDPNPKKLAERTKEREKKKSYRSPSIF